MRFFPLRMIVLPLLPFFGWTQNCPRLTGIVYDKHDQTVIAGARVTLLAESTILHTEPDGRFSVLACDSSGIVEVIPHFGCEPTLVEYQLTRDTVISIFVETHVTQLDEYSLIHYSLQRETKAENTVNTLDLQKVDGRSLGEQLRRIPAVTTLNTGSSIVKPAINGMHSNRVVIVNNGIRQEGQQWGSEHAPEIDPNLASELIVIQGASGLEYGPDAIGGVIITKPAELNYGKSAEGWLKGAGWSNGKGGMLSGLINGSVPRSRKLAYRIHATGNANGTTQAPRYLIRNTASNGYSFSAAAGYQGRTWETDVFYSLYHTRLGIFTGSHIGNLSDLEAALAATQPKDSGYFTYRIENPMQVITHHLSKVRVLKSWNERVSTEAIFGYQFNLRQEFDLHKAYNDSLAALGLPAFELNLWTNSLDIKTVLQIKKLKAAIGLSGMKQDNAYAGRFFIPNFRKVQAGMFTTFSYSRIKWRMEGGVRYDFSQIRSYFYSSENQLQTPLRTFGGVSANVGVSRTLGHHWIARVNAGTAWRQPSINELYSDGLHHGAAAFEIGDQTLDLERCYNLQTGIRYRSSIGSLEAQLFVNHFDGYLLLEPEQPPALTIMGAFPVFRYSQKDVNLNGGSFMLEVPFLKRFVFEGRGSFLYATSTADGKAVFGIPSNRLAAAVQFRTALPAKWELTYRLEAQQVFQQSRSRDDIDYAAAPNGYLLLNSSLGITRKTTTGQGTQLVFAVYNLTNTAYRDYMNRFRYFTNEQGINMELKVLVPIRFTNSEKTEK